MVREYPKDPFENLSAFSDAFNVRRRIRCKIYQILGRDSTKNDVNYWDMFSDFTLMHAFYRVLAAEGKRPEDGVSLPMSKVDQKEDELKLEDDFLDIDKNKGNFLEDTYLDISIGTPSYSESELPKVHIAFGSDAGSIVTLDTYDRHVNMTLNMSIYINSYLEIKGDDYVYTKHSTIKRDNILDSLENFAVLLDRELVLGNLNHIEGVTLFDLNGVDYNIPVESGEDYTYGVATLRYRFEYFLRYGR